MNNTAIKNTDTDKSAETNKPTARMLRQIRRAMQDCDHWVVEFFYLDSKGKRTRRVVSPIRFLPGGRLLALCLSREAPRQFYLNRCEGLTLKRAEDYLMPVPM